MKVQVNHIELIIFEGAKVKDAIRKYYANQEIAIPNPLPKVKDRYGNLVAEDGALLPNTALFIQKNNKLFTKNIKLFKP